MEPVFLIFLVLELDKADHTKEEQLRAIARQRAVWDYNTDIITAQEEGLEEGMKIFLRSMIETRFGHPLPDWVLSRLRTATPEQLQQWGGVVNSGAAVRGYFRGLDW